MDFREAEQFLMRGVNDVFQAQTKLSTRQSDISTEISTTGTFQEQLRNNSFIIWTWYGRFRTVAPLARAALRTRNENKLLQPLNHFLAGVITFISTARHIKADMEPFIRQGFLFRFTERDISSQTASIFEEFLKYCGMKQALPNENIFDDSSIRAQSRVLTQLATGSMPQPTANLVIVACRDCFLDYFRDHQLFDVPPEQVR